MYSAEEIGFGFVVAGCDGPELLEFCEEILDQVAEFIKVFIVGALFPAIGLGWDNDVHADLFK